uniref:Aldolase n=1 Tax=OCS116 cluster bacterium TaxID=2030921 RepID=A0A2A4YYW0_9PROT
MMTESNSTTFRQRLLAGEPLIGTFMKVPSSHLTEVMGSLGFDFVMLDEEHAPWTRATLDAGCLGARAFGIASMVRIARPDAANILSALDDGATGIMVPHVDSAEKAESIVSAAHYYGGTRGAGVGRGGEYGMRGKENFTIADQQTTIMAMIEDRQALDVIDDITSIEGIDAIFLGRGDLGLSLRNGPDGSLSIKQAVEKVAKSATDNGKTLSAVVQSLQSDDAKWLADIGVTAMMVASDIGFLQQAARLALKDFAAAKQTLFAK